MFDAVYFDMDGTIADLYGVEHWEERLNAQDATPYAQAQPMVNMCALCEVLDTLIDMGVRVGVISWLAMNSTQEYDNQVREAKREWIEKNLGNRIQETHLIKYGRTKLSAARCKNSILVDDNKKVRDGWHGFATIDANGDIVEALREYAAMLKNAA